MVQAEVIPKEVLGPAITAVLTVAATLLLTRFRRRDEKTDKAAELLSLYRDPLLSAAFELQSRLYNIVRRRFLQTYYKQGDDIVARYAEDSTLWILAQYLGWVEILRREVQFLDLGSVAENRRLQDRLAVIGGTLASDSLAGRFRIFRAHQRAVGEVMIRRPDAEGARPYCLGYAEFVRLRENADFWQWFRSLEDDLAEIAKAPRAHDRLVVLQRAAVDLVDSLDPDRIRYPNLNLRGRLPLPTSIRRQSAEAHVLARFEFHPGDGEVFEGFAGWAVEQQAATTGDDEIKSVRLRVGRLGAGLVVNAFHRDRWITITGFVVPPGWQRAMRMAPPAVGLPAGGGRWWWARRKARHAVNDLLRRYDRPEIV